MKDQKKIAIVVLLCFVLALFPTMTFAEDGTTASGKCGPDATWSFEDGTLTVTGSGVMWDFPHNNNDSLVSMVGQEIKTVVIGEKIKSIGDFAFFGCSSLESITIPDSVTSIGESAFWGCENLTNIIIPDSVTDIGDNAFNFCGNLTSITIPGSVTNIGNGVFLYCRNLEQITVAPQNIKYYSDDGVLMKNETSGATLICYPAGKKDAIYSMPINITSIGDNAFEACGNLTSITISDNVTNIGNGAFLYCRNLEQITVAPQNIKYYSDNGVLMENETSGATLICCPAGKKDTVYFVPTNITKIADQAFQSCEKLTAIEIPDSVTSIGREAFSCCISLIDIELPDNVTNIGNGTFYDCSSLTAIELPDNATSIGNDAFLCCSNLADIQIPNGVISIGDRAFSCCSSLVAIEIPDSVTSIGREAFSDCDSLRSISIPVSVTETINYGTFSIFVFIDDRLMREDILLTDIYYGGTKEQWENLYTDTRPLPETTTVHFNSSGPSSGSGSGSSSSSGNSSSDGGSSTASSTNTTTATSPDKNVQLSQSQVSGATVDAATEAVKDRTDVDVVGGRENSIHIQATASGANLSSFDDPLTVTMPVDKNTLRDVKDTSRLTLAKVTTDANGNTTLTYMGGNYDARTGKFTAYVDEAGDYVLVSDANVQKIELQIGQTVSAVNGMTLQNDVAPIIYNSRTMVPLRFIAETLGAQVDWNDATRTVTLHIGDTVLTMTIDQPIAGFDTAPIIFDGRTMVPIRYIAERLGANVIYVPQTQEIVVVK